MSDQDGSWLSAPGEYRKLVADMCASDPRLRLRDPHAVKQTVPWPTSNSQLTILEETTRPGGTKTFTPSIQGCTPAGLQKHLATRSSNVNEAGKKRVYILEGQNPKFNALLRGFLPNPPVYVPGA
jgi:hypothetical protein